MYTSTASHSLRRTLSPPGKSRNKAGKVKEGEVFPQNSGSAPGRPPQGGRAQGEGAGIFTLCAMIFFNCRTLKAVQE